jgi:predicted methyltransferase
LNNWLNGDPPLPPPFAPAARLLSGGGNETSFRIRSGRSHRSIGALSDEDARDSAGEFETVMRLAEIKEGMSIADIGAGEGYYTVRLSPIVGPHGRVLAQDIVPQTLEALGRRIQRERPTMSC